ncbi:hypothetical protein I3760_07G038300 [Carya illinoinensis]|uniref:Epidermal patterning factor-like protein n=1 Tax=Carya illinoinensis TaxID=32201 RepID=A0A8T1PZJ0_CARIL|nr:EPIDERMAL PATTERNING FACTOR-like protein 2 [Carya illinoinensis]KAG2695996.1 hypothetical protein I3760_07G038300 [Carya illinoinensis]KAG6646881.1 hypothetical protein CIPAW_07G039100 [Carya illinoinensis]KAG6702535.1 hypothetical protein I3842_07G039200 [Carya illinoinensis]
MGCNPNFICSRRVRYFCISAIFLIAISSTQLKLIAEARTISETFSKTVREDKAIFRARIGSRPPRCERRCSSCGPCEAIQVPTNPQVQNGKRNVFSRVSNAAAYARGDDSSNYKPISWKCKCGNLIFNP